MSYEAALMRVGGEVLSRRRRLASLAWFNLVMISMCCSVSRAKKVVACSVCCEAIVSTRIDRLESKLASPSTDDASRSILAAIGVETLAAFVDASRRNAPTAAGLAAAASGANRAGGSGRVGLPSNLPSESVAVASAVVWDVLAVAAALAAVATATIGDTEAEEADVPFSALATVASTPSCEATPLLPSLSLLW